MAEDSENTDNIAHQSIENQIDISDFNESEKLILKLMLIHNIRDEILDRLAEHLGISGNRFDKVHAFVMDHEPPSGPESAETQKLMLQMIMAIERFSHSTICTDTFSEVHAKKQGEIVGKSIVDAVGAAYFAFDFASSMCHLSADELRSELRLKKKEVEAFLEGVISKIREETPILIAEIDEKDREEEEEEDE